jgi:hypothetical protein
MYWTTPGISDTGTPPSTAAFYDGPIKNPFNYIGAVRAHELGCEGVDAGDARLGLFADEDEADAAVISDCLGGEIPVERR